MNHFYTALCLTAIAAATCSAQEVATHPTDGWDTTARIPATYYEDLMTNNIDIKPGHCWTVQVEENTTIPGWYRFQPYISINDYVPKVLQSTDETYMYINATDPERVYIEEFYPYADDGEYDFVNLVPENGWTAGEGRYGTKTDNVIAFAPRSFALYDESYDIWYEVSRNGGLKLVLNESEAKDYSVSVKARTCTSFSEIAYNVDCGNDVWDVKVLVKPGEFKDEYYTEAAANGDVIDDPKARQYYPVDKPGMYTVVVAGVDRKGNMVSCDYDFGFNVIDDDNWEKAGTATYTEDFLADRYIDITPATYDVELQKHKTVKGYYRIVNPYSNHPTVKYPALQTDHSHSHYIYINATDAVNPYIEASPIGVNNGNGDVSVASLAGVMIARGLTVQEAKDAGVEFGHFDEAGNLTFPAKSLVISEKSINKGEWQTSAPEFKLLIPEMTAGISGIETDTHSQYRLYNLQGMSINPNSNQPGVYIIRYANGEHAKIIRH